MTGIAEKLQRIPWRVTLPWPILLFALLGSIGTATGAVSLVAVAEQVLFHSVVSGVSLSVMLAWSLSGIAALVTAVAVWPPHGKIFAKLGIRPLQWSDVRIAVALCVAVLLIGAALTAGWQAFLDWTAIPYQKEQDLLKALVGASPATLILLGFVLTVMVPIGEEIFFRRILFGLFRPLGAWTAILLTSSLFACAHFFLYGIPALFVMGLGFQLAYLHRRNLVTAMLAHGLANLCALIGALFET